MFDSCSQTVQQCSQLTQNVHKNRKKQKVKTQPKLLLVTVKCAQALDLNLYSAQILSEMQFTNGVILEKCPGLYPTGQLCIRTADTNLNEDFVHLQFLLVVSLEATSLKGKVMNET